MDFHWFLWIALAGYAALLLSISPRVHRPSEFFRGSDALGRDVGLGLLVASVVISWLFAKSITNAANLGSRFGMVGAVAYAGWYLSIPVAGGVIWWIRTRSGARSLPEFVLRRYGTAATFAFFLVILVRLINEVWSNTAVVGAYFGAAGSPAYFSGAIAFTAVTLAYSLRGGLRSSILTDAVQLGLFVFLLVFVLGWVVPRSGFGALVRAGEWSLVGGVDLLIVALIQAFSYPFHDPVLTDRAFLASPRAILFGYLLAGLLAAAFIVLFGLTGVHAMLVGIEAGQDAPLHVAQAFGVAVLVGMTVLMMVSAGSTLDSTLSSCAKAVALDLQAGGKKPLSTRFVEWAHGRDSVTLGRWVMLVVVVVGTIPLFLGTAILKATTVSGTMVLGLAPPFLLFALKRPGTWAFQLAFWPGVAIGILHAAGRVPDAWAIGEGSYAHLLGANVLGTLCVFLGFGLGSVVDSAAKKARVAAATTLLLFVLAGVAGADKRPQFDLGGQTMLRLTARMQDLDRPSTEIYNVRLVGQARQDPFSFLVELRLRQTKLRSYSPSNVWLQQAYARWKTPLDGLQLSCGLIYNQLGLFWDGAWFGNLPYLNGHKLDPDMNLELAYSSEASDGLGISAWLQASPGEDGLNGSFATNEKVARLALGVPDPEVDTNLREALAARARVVPRFVRDSFSIAAGFSIQRSVYDRLVPEAGGSQWVMGAECAVGWGRLDVFGEVLREEIDGLSPQTLERDYFLLGSEFEFFSGRESMPRALGVGASYQSTEYDAETFDEDFLTGRLTMGLNSLLGVTVEYVRWQLSDRDHPELDRIEFILHIFY